MTDSELERLEREIEEARGRVAMDLARLTAPGALSEFKEDVTAKVTRTKDQLLDGAKDAAQDRAESIMSVVRARIAANPGAALAIAAGLGWKLYRHPPIMSLLVGAGLMGLMRTDPRHPARGSETAARAAELAGAARRTAELKADEWRQSDVPGQIGERAEEARHRLEELAEAASERIGAVAEAAREQVEAWRSAMSGSGGNGGSRYVGPAQPWRPAEPWQGEAMAPAHSSHFSEQRDRYLLGAAAFAIAAAVGIAAQRRFAESEAPDDDDFEPRHLPVPPEVYDRTPAPG